MRLCTVMCIVTPLIAGTPLELDVPKCNNHQDWAISRQDKFSTFNIHRKLISFNDYRKHVIKMEASRVHPSGWKWGASQRDEDIV